VYIVTNDVKDDVRIPTRAGERDNKRSAIAAAAAVIRPTL
jgi:hypothetical protein